MTTLSPHEMTSDATNAVAALDNLTVLSLTMPVWSGTKVMTPSELNAAGGTALPSSLVTNGGKKVIDPKHLNPFMACRRKAHRLLGSLGVAFAGGYAIPNQNADVAMQKLELIITEYEWAQAEFLANYTANIEDWIAKNPGYEGLLRAGVLTESEVEKKFGAYYTTLKLSTSTTRDRDRAGKLVEDLGTRALDEVSKDAAEYARGILTKPEVSRRGLGRIRQLRDKLYGLGFLSSAITPVVKLIDDVLVKMPDKGDLTGADASEWKALVMLLANRDMLEQFADGRMTFQSTFTLPGASMSATDASAVPAAESDVQSMSLDFDDMEPVVSTESKESQVSKTDEFDFDVCDFDGLDDDDEQDVLPEHLSSENVNNEPAEGKAGDSANTLTPASTPVLTPVPPTAVTPIQTLGSFFF